MWRLDDGVMAGREELVDPCPVWLYEGARVSYRYYRGADWRHFFICEVRHRSVGWYANVGKKWHPHWVYYRDVASGWLY